MNTYKKNNYTSELTGVKGTPNGQSLEQKIANLIATNTPIDAISPMVFTERSEGVRPETNIRTDRMEIALDAADRIHKSLAAARAERAEARKAEMKQIETPITE